MRTSSPVPDNSVQSYAPLQEAEVDATKENQFAALGTDKHYPEVVAHLETRKEFYRRYLPDGTAIASLSEDEAGRWWKCAATIISEIDQFLSIIEVSKDAIRQSRGR